MADIRNCNILKGYSFISNRNILERNADFPQEWASASTSDAPSQGGVAIPKMGAYRIDAGADPGRFGCGQMGSVKSTVGSGSEVGRAGEGVVQTRSPNPVAPYLIVTEGAPEGGNNRT